MEHRTRGYILRLVEYSSKRIKGVCVYVQEAPIRIRQRKWHREGQIDVQGIPKKEERKQNPSEG